MRRSQDFIWDDRAPAYAKSGDLAAAIATQHYGLAVDVTTRMRWQQLMSVMREVDTWADERAVTSDEVLQGLAEYTMFEELYPALAPGELTPEMGATLLGRTARILRLGRHAARAVSVERFVALRVAEARESVELFADIATPEMWAQPAFTTEFMPALRALGEAATV